MLKLQVEGFYDIFISVFFLFALSVSIHRLFELMKKNTSDVNDVISNEKNEKTIHRCTIFTSTMETRRRESVRWAGAPTWCGYTLIHYYSVFSMRHASLSRSALFTNCTIVFFFIFTCTFFLLLRFHKSFKWPTFCGCWRTHACLCVDAMHHCCRNIPLFDRQHSGAHKRLKSLSNIPLHSIFYLFFLSNI